MDRFTGCSGHSYHNIYFISNFTTMRIVIDFNDYKLS